MKVEDATKYNLDLILPIFLIILAELLIFLGKPGAAMPIHALNLVLLSLSSIYINNKIYPALMLLPLFRLLNVAMPVFFNLTLYSYSLVYAPMFIPIYFILKENFLSRSEAGLTFKGFWFYLPLAISLGFALGWGEYHVLHPQMLTVDLDIKNVFILIVTMIFFVGIVEEFVFRSSLQTALQVRLGSIAGLVLSSIIFGFMHSGYRLPQELLYVSFAGMAFGLLFLLSKSLPVIALAHGVTNISLFLIAPLDQRLLVYLIAAPALFFVMYAYVFKIVGKIRAANK
ncbi:MAG TPA: CPBP family intramembrane metalloprotease domain-containing protein [Tissierellales bacterium]|nr:CPBP family intramembrane metalloprotease domain-containing protein [Tissierellales bacterium]